MSVGPQYFHFNIFFRVIDYMITKIYYSDTTLEISLQHSVFIVVNSVLLVLNWKINPNIKLIYCNTHTHSFDMHIFLSGFFYNWHSPIAGHHWRRDVDSNSFLIFPPTSQTITAENSPLRIASTVLTEECKSPTTKLLDLKDDR